MHIAHIIDQVDDIGGVQTYLAGVLPALADVGITASVLVGRDPGVATFAGARVTVLPEAQRDGASLPPEASAAIRNALRATGADVCVVHIAPSPAVPAATSEVMPTIVFAHDFFPACPGNGRYLYRSERFCSEGPGLRCYWRAYTEQTTNRRPDRLLRSTARERAWRTGWSPVARVVVASRFVADVLVADGAPRERLDVVPYFVTEQSRPADAEPVDVVFMGRVVPLKGGETLVRALATLDGVRAVVGGDGPDRTRLERLAHELGIAKRIRFAGSVSGHERAHLLAGARVFALPSLWAEPFGISGLEALAAGVPVVASDVGGIASWLDESCGRLVPPGDVAALASALGELLADAGLRARLAAAATARAREFSLERHLELLSQSVAAAVAYAA